MDVVKRQIEAMGGTLDIRSEKGRGSVFSMQLPLTLAVIDGMVIRVANERYIIPTLSVVRLVNLKRGDILPVVGEADHRGDAALRLRPAGSQGRATGADHGQGRGRHDQ